MIKSDDPYRNRCHNCIVGLFDRLIRGCVVLIWAQVDMHSERRRHRGANRDE